MQSDPIRVDYRPFGDSGPDRPVEPARRGWLPRALRTGLGVMAALLLPFFVLVRMSVWAYATGGVGNWGAVLCGAALTVLILAVYLWLLRVKFQGRLDLPRMAWIATLTTVSAYLLFTLVYLSADNVKAPEVRDHYRTLHPVLRVATGTQVLFDRSAVITDTRRTADDYVRWGLPVNEASLHFEQTNGFVHALDLRTVGRPPWRVALMTAYYRLAGFRTLRHVGTADHLHVSLPPA